MSNLQLKINYLANSLQKRLLSLGNECPSCGSTNAIVIERKFLVTNLKRCDDCGLLYRTPTTTETENSLFYQKAYRQGLTTDVPTDNQLQSWMKNNFVNCPKNYNSYISLLKLLRVKEGAKILDYGCSWGYGSFQLSKNGYNVTGFEVSQPRCNYGKEKLGINATSSLEEIEESFDVIFSSHVIEHLPSVSKYLKWATEHLVSGGLLITISPNGSNQFRTSSPQQFSKLWGYYHPQLLDSLFYINYFDEDRLFLSSQLDDPRLKTWNKKDFLQSNLDSSELLCVWIKE